MHESEMDGSVLTSLLYLEEPRARMPQGRCLFLQIPCCGRGERPCLPACFSKSRVGLAALRPCRNMIQLLAAIVHPTLQRGRPCWTRKACSGPTGSAGRFSGGSPPGLAAIRDSSHDARGW